MCGHSSVPPAETTQSQLHAHGLYRGSTASTIIYPINHITAVIVREPDLMYRASASDTVDLLTYLGKVSRESVIVFEGSELREERYAETRGLSGSQQPIRHQPGQSISSAAE